MKKFIALSLATLSLSAFAGTTAQLTIKGTVAALLDINVAATSNASNLPLSGTQNDIHVADVIETSNNYNGYKVKARSEKGSKLVHINDNTSEIPYKIKYGTTSSSEITLSTSLQDIYTSNQRGVFEKDLFVSYVVPANAAAGEHKDTIHFEISAN